MTEAILPRRHLLTLAATPMADCAAAVMPAIDQPEGELVNLEREYQALEAELPAVHRALDDALALVRRLETWTMEIDRRSGEILDRLETTPAATKADAAAKVRMAQALIREGTDPGRFALLRSAKAEMERLRK